MASSEISITEAKSLSDLEPLGEGGYGLVFKANHAEWGTVAYKKLNVQHAKESDEVELRREAGIQSQLNHPNIVKFLALVFEPGHYGMVLEYMEFGEILDYIREYTPAWEVKLSMIQGIVLGLSYLHSFDPPIIHGDLKTQNMLLSENLRAKICDFGFAHWKNHTQSRSKTRVRFGTLTHVPPETWLDPCLRKTEQFDVYSLGICLWEIITVQKPFEIMLPSFIKGMVLDNKRPDLKLIPEEISTTMVELVKRCWDQEPTKRPTSFQMKIDIEAEMDNISQKSLKFLKKIEPRNREPITSRSQLTGIPTIDYKDLTILSKRSENVFLGSYKEGDLSRVVAVRRDPRSASIPALDDDVMNEAALVSKLRHSHIIEFIGVCMPDSGATLLVMEYAAIGSLDKFLQKHPTFSLRNIIKLISQVAQGMSYLANNRIVHGCLAAKNILLMRTHSAQISNFCYSKELLPDQTSCSVDNVGLFEEHLRWIAPDCHASNLISFKSDMWSFGVLTWESLSHGCVPYDGMSDDEIIKMLDGDDRLEAPARCPLELKHLMHDCWKYDSDNRPAFQDIVQVLRDIEATFLEESTASSSRSEFSSSATFSNLSISTQPRIDVTSQAVEDIGRECLSFLTPISQGEFTRINLYRFQENGKLMLVAGKIALKNCSARDTSIESRNKVISMEAGFLSKLRHDFILRLLGVCMDESKMILVTEYAIMGSIKHFLRKYFKTSTDKITKLIYQVAQGMAFLEASGIVHCNVAASNILLISEEHAKISNFQYCREINNGTRRGSEIRKSFNHWIAPESFNNNEFSSKSDVFCFGTAMWECMSYGADPNHDARDIQKLFEISSYAYYMNKPSKCPESVYFLMRECWFQRPDDRPTFRRIVWSLRQILDQMKLEPFAVSSSTEEGNLFLAESLSLSVTRNFREGHFGRIHMTKYEQNKLPLSVISEIVLNKNRIIPALTSFIHEARLALKLRHNHVSLYCGILLGQQFIASIMYASELGTLDNYIMDQSEIPMLNLIHFMYQVSQGMVYLQERRVLHLSLKASSLYLMSERHITIGNFRISKQLGRNTQSYCFETRMELAVGWTAPECLIGSVADFKSDIWSFGVTFHEILNNGVLPTDILTTTNERGLLSDDASLRLERPKICTDGLYALMVNCLQVSSNERPTFHDVVQTLEIELQHHYCIDSKNLVVVGKHKEGMFGSVKLAKLTSVTPPSLVALHYIYNKEDAEYLKYKRQQMNLLSVLMKLGHQNISKFIGFQESKNIVYVMEFVKLGPLDRFLNDNPLYLVGNLKHLIFQIAKGMAYLEANRIVHLDLRARNIRLSSPYHAKIDNFGLSRVLPRDWDFCDYQDIREVEDLTSQRFRWAAPESLEFNKANTKSDVWSFAVTVWEIMSYGVQPHGNQSVERIFSSIVNNEILEKPASCSREMYNFLIKCWRKNGQERPTFREIEDFFGSITEPFIKDVEYKIHTTFERLNKINFVESVKVALRSDELSRGRFGPVMQGVYYNSTKCDSVSGRTLVALKTIANKDDILEAASMFQHESEILSKLDHDNIIKCYGIRAGAKPMLMIESFAFGSLDKYLIGKKRLLEERIVTLMQQVACGMCHMRKCQIVHRNLRAENIVLVSEVHAKISNFEISVEFEEGQEFCDFIQGQTSVRWTAPECLKSRKFYFKSDVWSFGNTLWEAVSSGKEPADGRADEDFRSQVLDHKLLLRPNSCYGALYDLMLNCWREEMRDRPTFDEIVSGLSHSVKPGQATKIVTFAVIHN